ncbi:MAG: lamin tail domain-containing protein [Salinivirgaceae bacterium]|nr:lamin tail domain-containing protein [Salinivirgaceae bacterium]
MRQRITYPLLFFILCNKLLLSQLISFDFNNSPYLQPSILNENIDSVNFQLSSGTISTNVVTGDYFTNEPYVEESGGWAKKTANEAKYFYVDLSAKEGFEFVIDSVSFEFYVTGSGPSALSILVNDSLLETISVIADSLYYHANSINDTISLSNSIFKIAGWDNESRITTGLGAFRIDNVSIYGQASEIPPNDSTSSLSLNAEGFASSISSLINNSPGIKLFDFVLADSASGDGVPTIIDSIIFLKNTYNQFSNWQEVMDSACLYYSKLDTFIFGEIKDSSLYFNTIDLISTDEGIENKDTLALYLSLKTELKQADGKNIGIKLTPDQIFCNANGSQIKHGGFESSANDLILDVEATRLAVSINPDFIYSDSIFSILVDATDTNGNLDVDQSGTLSINYSSDEGRLNYEEPIFGNFSDGTFSINNLQYLGSDTVLFIVSADGFLDTLRLKKYIGQKYFHETFDDDLSLWNNTGDWTITHDSILKKNQLKHNLEDVEGLSYIAANYQQWQMDKGKMVWQFTLQNGDFDPTTSNRFWYYLMGSDSILTNDSIVGYAVGVNFTGSTDSLSLWRIDKNGSKKLLVQSDFNWNENERVAIEVIRKPLGIWQLAYSNTNDFENLCYATEKKDSVYINLPNHGLVFEFSSTRAGELWMDDISVFQLNTPPELVSSYGLIDTIFIEFSEPILDTEVSTLENYFIESETDEAIIIESADQDLNHLHQIKLKVNRLKTANYTISINGLKDLENSEMLPQSISFSYQVPAEFGDIIINEIMFDPSPPVGLPEYDYLEIYNRGENIFYLKDWKLDIGGVVKTFPDSIIYPNEYVIVTLNSAINEFEVYGKTVGILTNSLTNYGKSVELISPEYLLINSVYYKPNWITDPEKEDGGWSLEKLDPNNLCAASNNWNVSLNENGGTPGNQNSVYSENLDSISPEIINLKTFSNNLIQLQFSEQMPVANFQNLNNFMLENDTTFPDTIFFTDASETIVNLEFKNQFISETTYLLMIAGIEDFCGNKIKDTTLSFLYYKTQPNDIVFTEIMADPTPSVGLPEVSYLELYNRSNFEINLTGWKLYYDTYFKQFPEFSIPPNKYLLLCPNGQSEELNDYENVIDILSSTSLTSSGKHLQLRDTAETLITEVYYLKSWHTNPDKENGGWSLERIDVNNLCSTSQNWKSCENEIGGTPEIINSVNAENIDLQKPFIQNLKTHGALQIEVSFSEPINSESLFNVENYELLESNVIIDSLNSFGENSTIILFLNEELIAETSNRISIANLSDLCDNSMNDTVINFFHHLVETNDIIISEIMVDPIPSVGLPEFEYIEIFNRSNKALNLENWRLLVNYNEKIFGDVVILPNSYALICSENNSDNFKEYGMVIPVSGFPSLPNESAFIALQDSTGKYVNQITYNSSWYKHEEKSSGGWSLEIIDPDNTCSKSSNWTASDNHYGGTPGLVNSVDGDNLDTTKPKILQLLPISNYELLLEFSESFELDQDFINYFLLNDILNPISVDFDSLKNTCLHITFENTFNELDTNSLEIFNIHDFCGNQITDTSILFTYYQPKIYDIVINEIMANPEPSAGLPEQEYIELANTTSQTIYIYNWQLWVNNSERILKTAIIEPNEFIIIGKDEAKPSLSTFGAFIQVENLPNLPQSASLRLFNKKNQLICQSDYQMDWISDDFKADGGFSLERIDPANPNETEINWSVSMAEKGGTPGEINSIYHENPDEESPKLLRAFPCGDSSVVLVFSELMDFSELNQNLLTIQDQPNLISASVVNPFDLSLLELTLNSKLHNGVVYTVMVSDEIKDIAGNTLANAIANFAIASEAFENDIIINEILFNPKEEGVDFIELYNRSIKTINLKQLKLANRNENNDLSSIKTITNLGGLLFPNNYMLISLNDRAIKKQYIIENDLAFFNVAELPSMADKSGTLVLLDSTGLIIDEFTYSDDMHFGLLETTEGVSLERINHDKATQNRNNWHSASELSGWATPGYKNSVYKESKETNSIISVDPEVFSPDNDGYNDFATITYKFDEPGYVANVAIFDNVGRKIRTITKNELLGLTGYWIWDGLSDNMQKANAGIYIAFFEIFNLNGEVNQYKKVCTINVQF